MAARHLLLILGGHERNHEEAHNAIMLFSLLLLLADRQTDS